MSESNTGRKGSGQVLELPTVAVIIPCHNHADFVLRAMDSVVAQDYPRKFMAILDDESEDNSIQVIMEALDGAEKKSEDGHVRGTYKNVPVVLYQNDNSQGPSHARNLLLRATWDYADFFAFLDADDEYLPYKLSKSVAKMILDPMTIGLVYCDMVIDNIDEETYLYEPKEAFDRRRLEQDNIIPNSPLVNKFALQTVGVFDEKLRTCEDYDLWLRITEAFLAVHIPEPLQLYRVTGVNATFTVQDQTWKQNYATVKRKMIERNAGKN